MDQRSQSKFPGHSAGQYIFAHPLGAGREYYIEAIMKQGGGNDCLSVAWQPPGQPPPENFSSPIPGTFLAAYANPQTARIQIIEQPRNITAVDHQTATFNVTADSASLTVFTNGRRMASIFRGLTDARIPPRY